jgi:hypothetical protein
VRDAGCASRTLQASQIRLNKVAGGHQAWRLRVWALWFSSKKEQCINRCYNQSNFWEPPSAGKEALIWSSIAVGLGRGFKAGIGGHGHVNPRHPEFPRPSQMAALLCHVPKRSNDGTAPRAATRDSTLGGAIFRGSWQRACYFGMNR